MRRLFAASRSGVAVPSWWSALADNAWTTVAADVTAADVTYPDQAQYTSAALGYTYSGLGVGGFFDDYSGATVDQVRRELLMVANGGHADYAGNEGYALALWADSPYWYRLNDPTPVGSMTPGDATGTATENDGRSRAMHTYGLQCYANGRVWYPMQGHTRGASGSWIYAQASFDRSLYRESNAGSAAAWANNAGGWLVGALNNSPHGLNGANQWSGSTAVYDSVNKFVHCYKRQPPDFQFVRINVDPEHANFGLHYCYNQASLGGTIPSITGYYEAPVFIPDRAIQGAANGLFLTFDGGSAKVTMQVAATAGAAANNWIQKTYGTTNAPTDFSGAAAVYHGGAVYVMNWTAYGAKIFKLTLPADLDNGDWSAVWSVEKEHSAAPAGVQALIPVGAMSGVGQWTKFNLVRDMGDGKGALICASKWDGAASVYKVP